MKKTSRHQTFGEFVGTMPRPATQSGASEVTVQGWKLLALLALVAVSTVTLTSWRPSTPAQESPTPVGSPVIISGAKVSDLNLQQTASTEYWQPTKPVGSYQEAQTTSSYQSTQDTTQFQNTQSGSSFQGTSNP